MSKRLRQEVLRAKQLQNEDNEEEDKLKLQKERIYAPIIWRRTSSGIKIQDLKPNYFDDVLKMVEDYYFNEEVLCRNSNIAEDAASKKTFLDKVLFVLKDHNSLIALDEVNEDKIAGFFVLKAIKQVDFGRVFSRTQLTDGEAYKKYSTFVNYLNRKVDIFEEFQCDIYLRYYLLCIAPEYRKRRLGFEMMQAAIDTAYSLKIPVIMGVFSCFSLQKLAKKLLMRVIFEIIYVDWRDRMNEMIFEDPGAGNYTCSIMAGELPQKFVSKLVKQEPEPPKAKGKKDIQKSNEPKTTREEKRKQKEKKAAK